MKEKICLNKKLKTILKKVEIKNDYLVPDIKPDVVNVINTNGMVYLIKEQVENGKIKIEGNIDNYIVYLSVEGDNRSVSNTINFFEVIEDERINENVIVNVKAMILSMETKVLNERKLSTTIYLVLKIELSEENEIEVVTDLEGKDKQKLEKKYNIKNILTRKTVNSSLNDVLKINDDHKITEILKIDIEVALKETKMSFNKLLAKSEINIKVIYLDENRSVKMIIGTFPLMTFIETEKVSENYYTDFDYIVRNVFFKIQNEGNSIEFQIDFEIRSVIFEEKELNILEDVYSLERKLKVESENVNIELFNRENDGNYFNIKIDENFKIDNIVKVLGNDVKYNVIDKKMVNNIYNYECEMINDIYYEISNDKNIRISQIKIPFIYKSEKNYEVDEIELISKELKINLIGENINISAEIENVIEKNNIIPLNIIKEVYDEDYIDLNEYNLIIYFVKENDTIWKIAKKFNISFENLLKVNNLNKDDVLEIGRKIYIMK